MFRASMACLGHGMFRASMACLVASFPGLPRFFCSSVSVDNNTRMQKGGEKRGRPGIIHLVSDVRWTQGWT